MHAPLKEINKSQRGLSPVNVAGGATLPNQELANDLHYHSNKSFIHFQFFPLAEFWSFFDESMAHVDHLRAATISIYVSPDLSSSPYTTFLGIDQTHSIIFVPNWLGFADDVADYPRSTLDFFAVDSRSKSNFCCLSEFDEGNTFDCIAETEFMICSNCSPFFSQWVDGNRREIVNRLTFNIFSIFCWHTVSSSS